MKKPSVGYDDVYAFIRYWSTDPKNPPYDLVGVVQLLAAALDNLRDHAMQHEMAEIHAILDEQQREFLHRVLSSDASDNSE